MRVSMRCGFVCEAVDLFISEFSIHTRFSDVNVNQFRFVNVMWIMATCTETVFFMLLVLQY